MNNKNKTIRVGWIIWGTNQQAAARISGYNLHSELLRKGYSSVILPNPELKQNTFETLIQSIKEHAPTVIVMHKYFQGFAAQLLTFCRSCGIKLIYLACDPVKLDPEVYQIDGILAVSEILLSMICGSHNIARAVLPDAHETPLDCKKENYAQVSPKRLRLGFVSTRRLNHFPIALNKGIELITIANRTPVDLCSLLGKPFFNLIYRLRQGTRPEATPLPTRWQWRKNKIFKMLQEIDIAVLPESSPEYFYKSNNKLTQMMSFGLPVIAYPLPAYKEIVNQACNGYLADAPLEWTNALNELQDENKRKEIGTKARKDTFEPFSITSITNRFIQFCEAL